MGVVFAAPLALFGLFALPLIYWLLRVTPPRPREIVFPPTQILRDLPREKETPSKTPWWLLLLRIALAALIALAMAGPVWSPVAAGVAASGPTLIALDDGWSAAPTWERRVAAVSTVLEAAARAGTPVALWPLSEGAREPQIADAAGAKDRLRTARPKPFLPDRRAAAERVASFVRAHAKARIVWIADGLEQGEARSFAQALQEAAKAGASLEVFVEAHAALALVAPQNDSQRLNVDVLRASAQSAQGVVDALDSRGRVFASAPFEFGANGKAHAQFDLPVELRNDVSLLRIRGENSAGAVALLDAQTRVRRVAVIGGDAANPAQPLLSSTYYIEKALAPFAQVRVARPGEIDPIGAALSERPRVVALADVGLPPGESFEALTKFVEEGGVLLRFAGPRLANAADALTPVRLRRNGRVLGGAMSWETPKTLGAFDDSSPFAGLKPSDEITVTRQVLAEPEPGLAAKSWARLSDGTPLVTAEQRGKGVIVLFHVSADPSWSNLPISGLFIDMLKRIGALSDGGFAQGAGTMSAETDAHLLAPQRTLDGFGSIGAPPASAKPVEPGFAGRANPDHPPGFYGAGDAALAVQPLLPGDALSTMDYAALGLSLVTLAPGSSVDLRPWLLALVFAGFLIDWLATLQLAGRLRWRAAGAVVGVMLAASVLGAPPQSARAEPAQKTLMAQRDRDAALTARLAYVISGDARVDEASRLGLDTLARTLASRTSFSPGDTQGVDPAKDELAFYPMLYWPIVATAPQPSAKAVGKIAAYMKQGGTVIFDTRDALTARGGEVTLETAWLRTLTKGLDIPELESVPRDHVITKTFYLLDGFVGRYVNGETWVEALPPEPKDGAPRPVRPTDSVSSVVITSNDLASAWAADRNGQPLYPLTPGGARQREMALRGGVNLVMYTLTGNYKSDQVHVRDLLERLGQ